jgi:hypothetical protein
MALRPDRVATCRDCGNEFQSKRRGGLPAWCDECRDKRNRRTLPATRPCEGCGAMLAIRQYQSKKRFCDACLVKRSAEVPRPNTGPAVRPPRYVTCQVCGVELPKSGRGRYPKYCGEHKPKYEKHRKPRDTRAYKQNWNLVRKFGITSEQRAAMLASQGGACVLCGTPESDDVRLQVDHDHECCPNHLKTCGKCVRGLICPLCNRALGLMNDNPEAFTAMAKYIRSGGGPKSPNRRRLRRR